MTTLPPLPTGHTIGCGIFNGQKLFTADQMRAYGSACAAEYKADAERYRWLKSRKGLDLRTEHDHCVWTRIDGTKFNATHYLAEGGTQHGPAPSLDKTIDAAMLIAAIRQETP